MKDDPSAAADIARTMAVALAAAGASAEDIAETMKEALSAGLNLGDGAGARDAIQCCYEIYLGDLIFTQE